jgi:hypothetical protein
MRAARDALPYESAKLVATAVIDGTDFATMLDRARARSAKVLDAKPVEEPKPNPVVEVKLHLPMVPDKRYRRS